MSLLIVGACGAIAYNVLLSQNPNHKLPGSTAVRVQVGDMEVSGVQPQGDNLSSIDQLLQRTQTPAQSVENRALTASIQRQLVYLGFYKGAVDGQSGPQTIAAIKLYQRRNTLKQTGQVSGRLLEHLEFSRKIADASNATGSIPDRPAPSAVPSDRILRIQQQLSLFGYAPGTPDGVLGAATIKAIKQFEADRSLPVTGKITSALIRELGV